MNKKSSNSLELPDVIDSTLNTRFANHPLVSVAVVTYNQKDFLRECVESVLAQDYSNFEIVVADDGSKDGTQEMLLDYESRIKGKFVLRLSPSNRGITSNQNLALSACSGKYISCMAGKMT